MASPATNANIHLVAISLTKHTLSPFSLPLVSPPGIADVPEGGYAVPHMQDYLPSSKVGGPGGPGGYVNVRRTPPPPLSSIFPRPPTVPPPPMEKYYATTAIFKPLKGPGSSAAAAAAAATPTR